MTILINYLGAFRHGDQKPNFKVHDNKLSITLAIGNCDKFSYISLSF